MTLGADESNRQTLRRCRVTMLSLLQWSSKVHSLQAVYGAHDPAAPANRRAVGHAPLCNRLLATTADEAVQPRLLRPQYSECPDVDVSLDTSKRTTRASREVTLKLARSALGSRLSGILLASSSIWTRASCLDVRMYATGLKHQTLCFSEMAKARVWNESVPQDTVYVHVD